MLVEIGGRFLANDAGSLGNKSIKLSKAVVRIKTPKIDI